MEHKPTQPKSQIPGIQIKGFVTFWRNFRDDPLYTEKRKFSQFEAWLDLYIEASGIARNVTFKKRTVFLQRGQLVTSFRDLGKKWKWSMGSVRNFLKKLERRQTIKAKTKRSGPPRTIITILKYEDLNPREKQK